METPYHDYQKIIFDEMFEEHKSLTDEELFEDEIEHDAFVDECEEDDYSDDDCE